MVNKPKSVNCPLCGLSVAEQDDVLELDTRVMHVSCVESAHSPRSAWKHGDAMAWTDWARGTGAGSAVG